MKTIIIAAALLTVSAGAQAWNAFDNQSRYGNHYGNRYGNDSNSTRLYSPGGRFLGNLNDNRYDQNSVSNPYGRYGSRYSRDSINNPYGYGSPYGGND